MQETALSNLHHVGAIVRDAAKTAEYYESLGMGSFERLMVNADEVWIRGKRVTDLRLKVRMVHIGDTRFELIQPVAGTESIWQEVLDRRGECIHHLGFVVDDLEKAKAEMAGNGLTLIFSARHTDGGGSSYFETAGTGGLVFELFQRPSNYLKE
jgi:methylmalonyl-CoA/ethylmalonyl-CoA epimerase